MAILFYREMPDLVISVSSLLKLIIFITMPSFLKKEMHSKKTSVRILIYRYREPLYISYIKFRKRQFIDF